MMSATTAAITVPPSTSVRAIFLRTTTPRLAIKQPSTIRLKMHDRRTGFGRAFTTVYAGLSPLLGVHVLGGSGFERPSPRVQRRRPLEVLAELCHP